MNLILPDALVSFDELEVELEEAAFPFPQPQAKQGLQQAIQERGIKMSINSASSDGVFGAGTDKAVQEFQQKKSLTADGIVDSKTLTLMA
jgi:murein L,D-transpeptidase YcbB/YkuD